MTFDSCSNEMDPKTAAEDSGRAPSSERSPTPGPWFVASSAYAGLSGELLLVLVEGLFPGLGSSGLPVLPLPGAKLGREAAGL